MSNTPTPPSLYEKFIHGINDVSVNSENPQTTSPTSTQHQTIVGDPNHSPPTIANPLNRLHIPKVPASGIDPNSLSTFSNSNSAPEVPNLQGQGLKGGGKGKGMYEGQEKLEHTHGQAQDRKQPEMSAATRQVLQRVRKMIPPMLASFHKGQMGRVAVIGGSEDYTGAPYFSAMASARLGADMSHVICEPQAAQVIKSYSPNLMVHPLMRQSSHILPRETPSSISSTVIDMLPRLHVIVIGPGLGRDPLMHEVCGNVIEAARKQDIPFVLDADGLSIAQHRPELVMGYRNCVLTPNIVEFGRLCEAQGLDPSKFDKDSGEGAEALAKKFGGVTVVQKGGRDWISNGTTTAVCDLEGGYKRSGGQGDTLTGSLATFLGWRKAYLDRIWDHEGDLDQWELLTLAAMGGSAITRECSRLAFAKHGRSLQASDLTEQVSVAFRNLFEEGTGQDAKL